MPKEKTGTTRHLTQTQFFQLCQELLNKREVYTTEQPTQAKACRMLSEALGFEMGEHSLTNAQEATGVTWRAKGLMYGDGNPSRRNKMAISAVAEQLKKVCDALGLAYTDEFTALVGQAPGIPVKSIPPSNTIPVVNGRKTPP